MIGHNTVSGERLNSYVERLENLDTQAKDLRADRAVVLAEAKAEGFSPKIIGHCLRIRRAKPSDVAETNALVDTYLHALGLAPEPPLFKAMGLMSVDVTSRESVIEAMKKFVPSGGSITIEAGGKPVKLTRDADGQVSVTEVVERAAPPEKAGAKPKPKRGERVMPEVDGDAAEQLGRDAARADTPIIANPFPFGDERRPRWDLGWRKETGGDGMGPDEDR